MKKTYRLKTIWYRMKDRCYNKTHISYPYYGAKFITVCDLWLHNFDSFQDWALKNGYDDKLTLDRKNGRGNYDPSNCRWVTKKVQQANRWDNRRFNFNGLNLTAGEISDITGRDYYYEYNRNIRLENKL